MQKSLVRKGLVLGIILLFVGASVVPSITGYIDDVDKIDYLPNENETLKEESDFKNTFESIISLGDGDKLFMIGRITNLQIDEDETIFNPINLWFFGVREDDGVTTWYVGHTKNQNILFHISSSEFKGIITNGFIFGMVKIVYEYAPTITFQKEDKAYENTLTVISADPLYLSWNDIELQVDGTPASHGMTGEVIAGQIIDITAIAGTGAYTISIRHIPTNTLIGSYDFTAAS